MVGLLVRSDTGGNPESDSIGDDSRRQKTSVVGPYGAPTRSVPTILTTTFPEAASRVSSA
jgi:hypothetical protein